MVARNRRRNPRETRTPRAIYYGWKKDETDKLLDALRKRSSAGVPIVVEGRRDREALGRLGVTGKVFCLKAVGESRFHFLDRLDGFQDTRTEVRSVEELPRFVRSMEAKARGERPEKLIRVP